MQKNASSLEWLQTNSFGSFAMGCVDRVPRRKYHSLLTVREPGFGDPLHVLAETREVICLPHAEPKLLKDCPADFQASPMVAWTYTLGQLSIRRRLELVGNHDVVRIHYEVTGVSDPFILQISPLMACRPIHHLTHENPFLNGAVNEEKSGISIQPYPSLPRIFLKINGAPASFHASGRWERGIFYPLEHARGYEATEDHFCPGTFHIEIKSDGSFWFQLGIEDLPTTPRKRVALKKTNAFQKAAAAFQIQKKSGQKRGTSEIDAVLSGYPWMGESLRGTMISFPGLFLTTPNKTNAKRILEIASSQFLQCPIQSAPILPGQPPNILLDAALLYIRNVQLLEKAAGKNATKALMPAVCHILDFLRTGLDERFRVTSEGELYIHAGPYTATWMSAAVHGAPVTPRFGYAVEINALFYNAMHFALRWAQEKKRHAFVATWKPLAQASGPAFLKRFWQEKPLLASERKKEYLADTHSGSKHDWSLRPNQLWAIALPHSPVPKKTAEKILRQVRQHLLTPFGLRTLAPTDPQYCGTYQGTELDRDRAFHQGTVWPWLLGIYGDALIRTFGKQKARIEFKPIFERFEIHLNGAECLGHVSEIFNGTTPHLPGGLPAHAWSAAELHRLMETLK